MKDFLIEIFDDLSDYLILCFRGRGWCNEAATIFKNIINFIFIACIAAVSWYIAKVIIIRVIHMIVYKTENKYDDQLVNHKVVEPLSQIFPALYIYYLIRCCVTDQQ